MFVATKMQAVTITIIRCNFRMESTICQIEHNIFHLSNRTNRNSTCQVTLTNEINCRIENYLVAKENESTNRQASTLVVKYREIFLSVANEMQMADRKLYLADRPKNSLFAK